MNTAAKLAIGLFLVGGTVLLVVAGEKKASAAEPDDQNPQPNPQPNILPPVPLMPGINPGPNGGVVVVPPSNQAPPGDAPHPFSWPTVTPAPNPSGGVPSATPAVSIPLPGGSHLDIPSIGLPSIATQVAPTPAATPTSPAPLPPMVLPDPLGGLTPAVHMQPQAAATAPADTVAVVKQMLSEEGNGTNWRKSPEPLLKVWQSSRGLTPDGDFGTGTALKMAEEIGTLPIIRGWPRGSTIQGHWLPDYQAALLAKANSAPEPRATHLRAAAQREQGQGFGTPPKPILTQISFDPND